VTASGIAMPRSAGRAATRENATVSDVTIRATAERPTGVGAGAVVMELP
jgi:hypothetical protein